MDTPTCTNPSHDHTEIQAPDGGILAQPEPMRCRHCGEPAHHDATIGDYQHDNPRTADCFLITRRRDPAPCTFEEKQP